MWQRSVDLVLMRPPIQRGARCRRSERVCATVTLPPSFLHAVRSRSRIALGDCASRSSASDTPAEQFGLSKRQFAKPIGPGGDRLIGFAGLHAGRVQLPTIDAAARASALSCMPGANIGDSILVVILEGPLRPCRRREDKPDYRSAVGTCRGRARKKKKKKALSTGKCRCASVPPGVVRFPATRSHGSPRARNKSTEAAIDGVHGSEGVPRLFRSEGHDDHARLVELFVAGIVPRRSGIGGALGAVPIRSSLWPTSHDPRCSR